MKLQICHLLLVTAFKLTTVVAGVFTNQVSQQHGVLFNGTHSIDDNEVYDAEGETLDAEFPAPTQSLASVSNRTFTIAGHPSFPDYGIRIKKTRFCDGTVNAYTGYIDVGTRHIFFYFFESRSSPETDDVIFWTNGGPGASSALGLFMELGPCRIENATSTKFNPHSWNSNANIFFVDQPISVGFSYASYGEHVSTTEEAATDIAAFIAIFFEHFVQFKGRGLHMAGESYGGRYIPVFASAIYDQNAKLVEAGLTPINLKSVMIGNGWTDFFRMVPSYFDMACTSAAAFLDISTCIRMKKAVPLCRKWTSAACIDMFDPMSCGAAMNFCSNELQLPVSLSGKNPYDVSKDCEGQLADTLCYPITKSIQAYLDQPDLRKTLGVDPSVGNFKTISPAVEYAFGLTLDRLHPTQHWLSMLLERKVRTLIYVGEYDWICNWIGNDAFTLAMEWSGQSEFAKQPLRDWTVDKRNAGKVRTAGPLTFATIKDAGHMVPYDKPIEALALVNRWINEEPL
ncbi:hypothetical protein M0805_004407 [Coniferiporia weirii]|nr:hypothetical protein M0805_004407 [Coniferiporia weirii]